MVLSLLLSPRVTKGLAALLPMWLKPSLEAAGQGWPHAGLSGFNATERLGCNVLSAILGICQFVSR